MRAIAIWLSLLACTLTGCAGFRGGWESVAYIGDAPSSPIEPAMSAYERNQRPPLSLPGMSLQAQPGLVFSPRQAVLTFGGRQYQAVAGYEFGQFAVDPSRPAQWEYREVPTDMALHAVQEQYLLSIDFDAPSPSPEAADITIDLSRALRAPGLAEGPLIRFVPVRWKEGYT